MSGLVNIPTPSAGLSSLTFHTLSTVQNNVTFVNTPPGAVTFLTGGTDHDVTNVSGADVSPVSAGFDRRLRQRHAQL